MSHLNQEKKIYTIDDIAKELGISKTTVSRAISGKGRLSAETRTRVLDFIEKHNYRPNAVAKSLAQNRTNNIGLILPGGEELSGADFSSNVLKASARSQRNRTMMFCLFWTTNVPLEPAKYNAFLTNAKWMLLLLPAARWTLLLSLC